MAEIDSIHATDRNCGTSPVAHLSPLERRVSAYRPAPPWRDRQVLLVSASFVVLSIVLVRAATAIPAIDLKPIATGLALPTGMVHAGSGSGRLFITQ